jgi:hypothetical protein
VLGYVVWDGDQSEVGGASISVDGEPGGTFLYTDQNGNPSESATCTSTPGGPQFMIIGASAGAPSSSYVFTALAADQSTTATATIPQFYASSINWVTITFTSSTSPTSTCQ